LALKLIINLHNLLQISLHSLLLLH